MNAVLPHGVFFASDVGCPTGETPKIMSTVPVQNLSDFKKKMNFGDYPNLISV